MNDLTEIGKITKPQGLKGEIKVQPLSNNPERFLNYKYIYLGKDCNKTNVINVRTQGGFVYMMIEGVNSIDDAELLRNQLIYIDKSQLPKLEEDEYFVLGDNRNNSMDSRVAEVGNIKRDELIGKVWIRITPFSEFGKVE